MEKLQWFERKFDFGFPAGMLPFFLERLEGTALRLEHKVRDISDELLSGKYEGKWSVKENIAHLAEVDAIAIKRIDEMINSISPMSPAIIQPSIDYNVMPVREVMNFFRENRQKNLVKYYSLTPTELRRSSIHPRLKVAMTPVDLAFFDAEHDDHHSVRITEILTAITK